MKDKKTIIEKIFFTLYIISIIIAGFILCYGFIGEEPDPVGVIALLYLCFCAYAYHKHKLDEKQSLHNKVAWIAERKKYGEFSSNLRDSELVEYIRFENTNQNVPQQYRIDFSNETEKEYLSKILDKHKEHTIEKYFCNRLKETEDICQLKSLEYYFFSLHCFVYDNTSSYKDTESYCKKEYISDWQFKCQLSEYGRVYYKLELITRAYIENNEQVQKLFGYIDKERQNHIMETLDKNEVSFLSYRP